MITVFTTKTCAYCRMVKQFLEKRNLEYSTVDLEEHPGIRQQLLASTGAMTVPITEVNGQFIVGWQPAKLVELTKGL